MRKAAVFALLPLLLGACRIYEERTVIPGSNPVAISQAIAMHQEGVPDGTIISEIRTYGVTHSPTAEDVVWMQKAGLSDPVITAMINARIGVRQPDRVVVNRYYDDSGVGDAVLFGLGAIVGWSLGRHHHYHRHYSGCGHRW